MEFHFAGWQDDAVSEAPTASGGGATSTLLCACGFIRNIWKLVRAAF